MSPELLALLYDALNEQIGICVATSNVELLRARFYSAMREAPEEFDNLQLSPDPQRPETHLWIIKKKVTIDAEEP